MFTFKILPEYSKWARFDSHEDCVLATVVKNYGLISKNSLFGP